MSQQPVVYRDESEVHSDCPELFSIKLRTINIDEQLWDEGDELLDCEEN